MEAKTPQGLFHVIDSFTIKRRNEVYLIGNLLEGEINAQWFVNIPLNKSLSFTCRISQIEDVEMANNGGSYKLIIVSVGDSEMVDFLFAMNIGSEQIEITIEGED
jgi:hypothetical protein